MTDRVRAAPGEETASPQAQPASTTEPALSNRETAAHLPPAALAAGGNRAVAGLLEPPSSPSPPAAAGVPVLFGFDAVGRKIYASVTVPGHTVADISTYVYGSPDKVVGLQQANGVRDVVPPGRNLTLVPGAFTTEAQRVVDAGLRDGTILRSSGIPAGESGGPVVVYQFAAAGRQYTLTEGQLRAMAQGQAAWVTRKATRLHDYAEIGRDVHKGHLADTNGAVRWISDWLAGQDELPLSVWDEALAKSQAILDGLAAFDASGGAVGDAVTRVAAQAAKLAEAAQALDQAERAWHGYIEGTIQGAGTAVHHLEIVRDTSFMVAAGLAGAAAAPVVFAAAGTGLATVGVTGTAATVLSGTAAIGAGAMAGGTANAALNTVAPSSTDQRPVGERLAENFRRGALAGGLGAAGALAAPGVAGTISQRLYGVTPEAVTGFGARVAVGTTTGVTIGAPLGAAGAGIENVGALARGEIGVDEYLRRIGWGALSGGIAGAVTGFLGSAFARPAATGGAPPLEPDVIYQPPRVDPRTGVVTQMAFHRPSGSFLRATYDPATATGEIVNMSTGQQVAVVRNGVVSAPAKAFPAPEATGSTAPGSSAADAAGTTGAGTTLAGPTAAGTTAAGTTGAGSAIPRPALGPGPGPGPAVVAPVPADPAADAKADPVADAKADPVVPGKADPVVAAKLAKALAENGLTGDSLFDGVDGQTAGKVNTALTQWPRAIPPPLRARLVQWGRDGCGGSPREFANRVEYARALFSETRDRFAAELAATTPAAQLPAKAAQAAAAAMSSETGMAELSAQLAKDLAAIAANPRSGALPPGLTPAQVPDAVRALPALPYESGTAEAYHAHKHMGDLPAGEQNLTEPIESYAASMRETVRSGKVVLDEPSGTSRKIVYEREADGVKVEAIVYVDPGGNAVVASYGKPKAVKVKATKK
ncbi:hypothetical protein ACQP2F_33980 [Actinoplanes sp. CA-030573]|uniref:hypothetical protein n=1 Tax=Actinoplanes sp. CA-030573 TaxID=3239898 RepID=UPI003D9019C9